MSFQENSLIDVNNAVKIADRVWWVGHILEKDSFQCHSYLIEQGDHSVLIDPGSVLSFNNVIRKVKQVIPLTKLKYIVCHHQDPDITGSLQYLEKVLDIQDVSIITHWRAMALIKHYGIDFKYFLIEENNWKLKLEDRELRFVFTPYAHFPGAFCSYDIVTKALFSSDLFGGFTETFSLFATDESYFESMRPFHEHYIPGNEILSYAMAQIESLELDMILPQHGSIIRRDLIPFMISKLRSLDCGMFLMIKDKFDVQRLSRMNQFLRDITDVVVLSNDFKEIAVNIFDVINRILPIEFLDFYAVMGNDSYMSFLMNNRFQSRSMKSLPDEFSFLINVHRENSDIFYICKYGEFPCLLIPVYFHESATPDGFAVLGLKNDKLKEEDNRWIAQNIIHPIEVTLEREVIMRSLEMERQSIYEKSIKDPLTGLYNRLYMKDTLDRLFSVHDRDESKKISVSAIMFDIDHFKSVNDTFGHNTGDIILKRVSETIMNGIRVGDIPVRFGGEEFIVFLLGETSESVIRLAERLRTAVEQLDVSSLLDGRRVTISGGTALRKSGETLEEFLNRADHALYKAKETGRNRVISDELD